jgi:hypothetical protein
MTEDLAIILFCLPVVLVSPVVSSIGIVKNKFWLVVLGAVLMVPLAYYLNGAPGSRGLPILLPVLQLGSAVAVLQRNKFWAWLLLVPSFLAGFWFLGIALFYQFQQNLLR